MVDEREEAVEIPERFDAAAFFDEWLEQTRDELGRVTIAVIGRSGAGKSTLVNALFGAEVAAAGVGRPVTKHLEEHRGTNFTLLDSPGLLVGVDVREVAEELATEQERRTAEGGFAEAPKTAAPNAVSGYIGDTASFCGHERVQ